MAIVGQQTVLENIVAYGGGALKNLDRVMDIVRFRLDAKIRENITLRDHSLEDLAKMGHPYAKRHGPKGMGIHDPYYQVHEQSGQLRSALQSGIVPAKIEGGRVEAIAYAGLDEYIAPHAAHVIWGTSKMIPRPVLEGSRQEVLPECQAIIADELKNLTVNFKGKS